LKLNIIHNQRKHMYLVFLCHLWWIFRCFRMNAIPLFARRFTVNHLLYLQQSTVSSCMFKSSQLIYKSNKIYNRPKVSFLEEGISHTWPVLGQNFFIYNNLTSFCTIKSEILISPFLCKEALFLNKQILAIPFLGRLLIKYVFDFC
jgi:hypothetical protein